MATVLIGARIKARREELKLSQDDLARLFGFKDRQTVSAIETGERRVTAEELLIAAEKLGKPLDYFTDPFRLVGEGRFSWRQSSVETAHLSSYERVAGRWIAAAPLGPATVISTNGPLLATVRCAAMPRATSRSSKRPTSSLPSPT